MSRTDHVLFDLDLRKLAAVDMYGARGTRLRRRVILVEFLLGAVGGAAFGVWVMSSWGGALALVTGTWLLGLAVNYSVLAIHAIKLSPSGALDAELHDIDLRAAFRRYNVAQFWIFVPVLFAILATVRRTKR